MADRVAEAEARLRDRMATARARHAGRRRFRSYVVPIGLVAVGLLAGVELGHQPGGILMPVSPLIAAAVFSRVYGGVVAARVAVAIACPIMLYIAALAETWWYLGSAASVIGLCVDADWLPALLSPTRQSSVPWRPSTRRHHMWIR